MARTPSAFTFTETMGGYVAMDAETYREGAKIGKATGDKLRFKVTIQIDDVSAFRKDPAHRAKMTGVIDSGSLGRGLAVEEGTFNLLQRMENGRLRMGYLLKFRSKEGVPYVVEGFKDVYNDRVIDMWYDTTALFTTLRREDAPEGEQERGILRIRLIDLVPQVISMRDPTTRNVLRHAKALVLFNSFFALTLAREYARPPKRDGSRGPE